MSIHADRSACKPAIRGELIGASTCAAAGFTADQASIGTYADEAAAVAAIFQHTAGGR